jgi:UDP-N-acetylmuramoyl-tripeptide--D-alanyl-D-alanine ligase
MQELGVDSHAEHQNILEYATKLGIDKIYTVGVKMKNAGSGLSTSGCFDSTDDLLQFLKLNDLSGKSVLLKASRSTSLENIVSSIKEI